MLYDYNTKLRLVHSFTITLEDLTKLQQNVIDGLNISNGNHKRWDK